MFCPGVAEKLCTQQTINIPTTTMEVLKLKIVHQNLSMIGVIESMLIFNYHHILSLPTRVMERMALGLN